MMVTKHELKEGSKDEYEDKQELEVLNSMVPSGKRIRKMSNKKIMNLSIRVHSTIMRNHLKSFLIK